MFNKLKQLQSQSENAINVFQKTIDSLNKTNEKILKEKERKVAKIKALQAETVVLTGLETTNLRVVNKMQTFLNE